MARPQARAPRGRRACGTVPFGGWRRLTVLGALSSDGIVATMSIEAATSTAVFLAYLDRVLVPELRRCKPDATVVMDNLRPHKAKAVAARLEQAGLGLLYLPRYSPDLSPIEPGWSKLKTRLRAKAARTIDALDAELGPALDAITPQDAAGWFRHCGYPLD
jgi:transposase